MSLNGKFIVAGDLIVWVYYLESQWKPIAGVLRIPHSIQALQAS
jgi:hypothetical protein